MGRITLACDLGGTTIKIGIVRHGRLLAKTTFPAMASQPLATQLPSIKGAWLQLLSELGLDKAGCVGVSMSFPSLIEPGTGRVLTHYGKYTDAPRLDLRGWAQSELSLPLAIENDARMALVGEWKHGAGTGCENLVILTLGTGLGTAALIEGRLVRGRHGQAAIQGGHLTVQVGGRKCACGNLGCAEAEASTGYLRELAQSYSEWAGSSLRNTTKLDYAAVFKEAAAGDACAVAVRNYSLQVWSAASVNLIHAYDPEALILGGGIMGSANEILPAIQAYLDVHAHTPWGKVRVLPAQLGGAAPLLASEWLLQEQFPELEL